MKSLPAARLLGAALLAWASCHPAASSAQGAAPMPPDRHIMQPLPPPPAIDHELARPPVLGSYPPAPAPALPPELRPAPDQRPPSEPPPSTPRT